MCDCYWFIIDIIFYGVREVFKKESERFLVRFGLGRCLVVFE